MTKFEEQKAASAESLRENIRTSVRDSIDTMVNEKAKEKGHMKEKEDDVDVDVDVDVDKDDGKEKKDKKKKKDKDSEEDDEEDPEGKLKESFDALADSDPVLYVDILETVALLDTDSGETTDLTEASRRKAAAIGFAIGGGLPGAAIGASFAKGKQRSLQDQIDGLEKKIQEWEKDPEKNKSKIDNAKKKIDTWNKQLQYLTSSGKGDAGMFRSSYAKSQERKK